MQSTNTVTPTTAATSMNVDPTPTKPEQGSSRQPLEENADEEEEYRFDQWVDYLPHDVLPPPHDNYGDERYGVKDLAKRVSLDVTESHMTDDDDSSSGLMDTHDDGDWPDSASLEDYAMVPNALLVEHDPVLQHELLLTDPSVVVRHDPHHAFTDPLRADLTSSLQDALEDRRRVLRASMEASQRTRARLEPHIRQRARWTRVLSDIEGSSRTLREHVLHQQQQEQQDVVATTTTAMMPPPPLDDHHDCWDDEEMLASAALDGLDGEDDDAIVPAPPAVGM